MDVLPPEPRPLEQRPPALQGERAREFRSGGRSTPPEATPTDGKAESSLEDSVELSPQARREVAALKAQDQRVRAHEAAHMAAGGSLVRGGATYGYKRGPDGSMYAVSGEVSLDSGPEKDPRATLAKAQRIRAAALAPADPSPTDRAAAAAAGAMAAQARAELARQSAETLQRRGIGQIHSLGRSSDTGSNPGSAAVRGRNLDISA